MPNDDDGTPAKKKQAASVLRTIRGKEFAKRLTDQLLIQNLSQSDLARMTGLGRDSISGYITKGVTPSPASIDLITKALGVKREDLQPAAYRATISPGKPLMKMQPVEGNPEMAWLILHQKIPTSLALKIIEMVKWHRNG